MRIQLFLAQLVTVFSNASITEAIIEAFAPMQNSADTSFTIKLLLCTVTGSDLMISRFTSR